MEVRKAMAESHSLCVVRESVEKVRRFFGDEQYVPSVVTKQGMLAETGVGLARKLARLFGVEICRAGAFESLLRRSYNRTFKTIAVGTVVEILNRPADFDYVYDRLFDGQSRAVFDWFVAHRVGLAILGQDVEDVFPSPVGAKEWEEMLEHARVQNSRGAFHLEGLVIESGLVEVVGTFFAKQYEPEAMPGPRSGELVLDCGAYRGETSLWYAKRVGRTGSVIAIEPNPGSVRSLRANIVRNAKDESMSGIDVVEAAVGDREGEVPFAVEAGGSSRVNTAGRTTARVTTIDAIVQSRSLKRVDVIKMDLEGGEIGALEGAKDTLSRYAPRLAIAAYHRPRDLPDIARLILGARADYRVFLSHKAFGLAETMLFACTENAL
jgi:FkbM family methyltransferase